MSRALAIVAALACGCATTTAMIEIASPAPSKLRRWHEWHSVHLTVDSDVDDAQVPALIREFERSFAAFDALLLADLGHPRTRLRVVLFASAAHYNELGPPLSHGVFVPTDADDEDAPTIFMRTEDSLRGTVHSFQHELTHRHLDRLTPRALRWLSEGIAELWSSLDVGDHDVRLGFAPAELATRDIGALLRMRSRSFYDTSTQKENYRLAAAFAEYLWFEEHAAFVRALSALYAGATAESALAPFQGQSTRDGFERWYAGARGAANRYFMVERYELAVAAPLAPDEPRLLGAGEVLRLCAALGRTRHSVLATERARTWLEAAALFDPFDPDAYYWAGVVLAPGDDVAATEAAFTTALALRPDDPRALADLASLRLRLRPRADDFSAVEPLVARLSPRTSLLAPLWLLANYAHARGDDAAAFGFIRRAIASSPSCIGCRTWLASLHNVRGEIADAEREFERTVVDSAEATPENVDTARAWFAKVRHALPACAAGDLAGCGDLADAYASGRGAPFDPALALTLYRSACDLGYWRACLPVSNASRLGVGAPHDPAAAAALLTRACAGGEHEACNNLGDQYEHGDGVPRDLGHAITLYRDACAHDIAIGCLSLATLAWRGLGLAHDEAQILAWVRQAAADKVIIESLGANCARDAAACAVLSLAKSRGVLTDEARSARDLMTLACRYGDAAACAAF